MNHIQSQKKPSFPLPKEIWQDPLYFIAFGFGSGAIPFAPGTFATLFAIPFYLLLHSLPLTSYLVIVVLFCIFSMWLSDTISKAIKIHDHPGMCIDEFAGFFVTMIHAPFSLSWILLGFILFRIFDIWKPWPIRWIDEHVTGGFGIVLDDILAGIYAMVIIQIMAVLF